MLRTRPYIDLPRRNDLDGRGNLSKETLADFAMFFLNNCIDQIAFMENLVQPETLRDPTIIWWPYLIFRDLPKLGKP